MNDIAVLLPHYNNCNGLRFTLESLLEETEEFTLFIFDDKTDDLNTVRSIVQEFSDRLKIVLNVNNLNVGITKTLNLGLKHILNLNKFSFIARLDAGDVCLNNRFKNQKTFLLENRDIALLGSWVKFVDVNRKQLFIFKPPSDPERLRKVIHCYNPFIHPAVMFRIDVVKKLGYYSENYQALEDHAYFFKVIKAFKTSVFDSVLLEYEINPKSISSINRKIQTKSRIKLFKDEYKYGVYPTIGLLRAIITHLIPQRILVFFKKNLFYK